jgi:hypothetical protein
MRQIPDVSDAPSGTSKPKRDTRKEAAKRGGVSERKIKQATFIKKEAPARAMRRRINLLTTG